MKTLKTCKSGCGKMKSGGKVKSIKRYDNGGTKTAGDPPVQNLPEVTITANKNIPKVKNMMDLIRKNRKKPVPVGTGDTNSSYKAKEASAALKPKGKKGMSVKTKYKDGGNTGGYAPAQKGGDNTKMGIYGIPNAGRTDSLGFKKGGSTTSRAVKSSCKGGLVRDYDGNCVTERKMKSGGPLKPVNKTQNPGLAKLPTAVRNKMGYAKKGGIKKR